MEAAVAGELSPRAEVEVEVFAFATYPKSPPKGLRVGLFPHIQQEGEEAGKMV